MGTEVFKRRDSWTPHDHNNPYTPKYPPHPKKVSPDTARVLSALVSSTGVILEHVSSHPWWILRSQIQLAKQLHHKHILPTRILPVIYNLHRHQGLTVLCRGLPSVFVLKGLTIASDTGLSELFGWPATFTGIGSIGKHLSLKWISSLLVSPFSSAVLIQCVGSIIAQEERNEVMSVFTDAFRLVSQTSFRQLPFWHIAPLIATYQTLHYAIFLFGKHSAESIQRDKQPPTDMSRLMSHDGSSDIYQPTGWSGEKNLSALVSFLTGSLIADVALFPVSVILTRLVVQGSRAIIDDTDVGLGVIPVSTKYEGFLDCARSMLTEEGVSSLFSGFGCLILQYGFHIGLLRALHAVIKSLEERDEQAQRRAERAKRDAVTGGSGDHA